jgi:excinuclease ABC subunit A
MALEKLVVRGARQHNLKNVTLEIPRSKLVVMTGLSGSGKSSLAFDTIYAEGQRRYVESLSAYARQFLGQMEKPDVDSIEGLSPAIAIEQKTHGRNPRSTVGTVTEIYDYLRLLYARVGEPHCHKCGRPIKAQSVAAIVDQVLRLPEGTKFELLAPIARGRKGEFKKIFEEASRQGFNRVRVDGQPYEIAEAPALDKRQKHDVEVVVDRLVARPDVRRRLADSLETALRLGQDVVYLHCVGGIPKGFSHGSAVVQWTAEDGAGARKASANADLLLFSTKLACAHCALSFEAPEPRNFSFNGPQGACPECMGLGQRSEVDPDLVVNPELSLKAGAIEPWSGPNQLHLQAQVAEIARHFKFSLETPFKNLKAEHRKILLYGAGELRFPMRYLKGDADYTYQGRFEGVVPRLTRLFLESDSEAVKDGVAGYMRDIPCRACGGRRLKPESLAVTVAGRNIIETTALSVRDSLGFLEGIEWGERERSIAKPILKELKERLGFLDDVGLDYLTLDRASSTLSGGEAQRIHLATQIGSSLVGVLYILDEPSIGLHQRDNARLLNTLKRLRDLGNTVLVVEHDEETMMEADYLVDIGPGAGVHGGHIVAQGTPREVCANPDSLTGAYLSGRKTVPLPSERRPGTGKWLELKGARLNNLKGLDVRVPLGKLVAVTGVSGSGKSTLVEDTLVPALKHALLGTRLKPEGYAELRGADFIDKIINIDQAAIGRTPRSNPATYTGIFDEIRKLFAATREAKERGYEPGRFSFNVRGGRCEDCQGDGMKRIEMHFLPDMYVPCATCDGKRYNRETLEVLYKGRSIAEVLDMIVSEALGFFEPVPAVHRILKTLQDVGLDYLKLGQPATTLSGGEAQRIKLSSELAKRATGRTLYVLDEPTTGLHFEDVRGLLEVLSRLVEVGNTVLVIEHNLDVIKCADHVIDLGPEGGARGGRIVAEGTPEEVAAVPGSHTGVYLKKALRGAAAGGRSDHPKETKGKP